MEFLDLWLRILFFLGYVDEILDGIVGELVDGYFC